MESEISWAAAIAITLPVSVVLVATGLGIRELAIRGADGRLSRNRIAGLRSPATLASDEAWIAGHQAGLGDTVRGGTVAIWSALAALGLAWLLGLAGALDPEGVIVAWTVLILVGVVAMSVLLVRGFIHGNRAAKALES